jgi:hypothetical protein
MSNTTRTHDTPCQDEATFDDDLRPAKGVITSVGFAACIWIGVLVWCFA